MLHDFGMDLYMEHSICYAQLGLSLCMLSLSFRVTDISYAFSLSCTDPKP